MSKKNRARQIIEIMGLDPNKYTGLIVIASDESNRAQLISGLPMQMAEDISILYFDDDKDLQKILDVFMGFVQYKKQSDSNIKGLFGNQEAGEA